MNQQEQDTQEKALRTEGEILAREITIRKSNLNILAREEVEKHKELLDLDRKILAKRNEYEHVMSLEKNLTDRLIFAREEVQKALELKREESKSLDKDLIFAKFQQAILVEEFKKSKKQFDIVLESRTVEETALLKLLTSLKHSVVLEEKNKTIVKKEVEELSVRKNLLTKEVEELDKLRAEVRQLKANRMALIDEAKEIDKYKETVNQKEEDLEKKAHDIKIMEMRIKPKYKKAFQKYSNVD